MKSLWHPKFFIALLRNAPSALDVTENVFTSRQKGIKVIPFSFSGIHLTGYESLAFFFFFFFNMDGSVFTFVKSSLYAKISDKTREQLRTTLYSTYASSQTYKRMCGWLCVETSLMTFVFISNTGGGHFLGTKHAIESESPPNAVATLVSNTRSGRVPKQWRTRMIDAAVTRRRAL